MIQIKYNQELTRYYFGLMPKRRFIFLFGYVRITNITVPAHGNRTCIPRPPSYYSVVSRKDPGIINFGYRSSLCRTVYIPSYDLPNKKFALFRLFLLVIVLSKFRRDMSLALRRVVIEKWANVATAAALQFVQIRSWV